MGDVEGFRHKLRQNTVCLGACISFIDPTVTEALCSALDFVWIDMEHTPLSLERVQGHLMATKGSDTVGIVRVPWNDPVLIKPVLDIGAQAVIVPMVRTADERHRAVAACLYPPQGIRGFGPRRPSNYGRASGPDFCRAANAAVLPIVQIEHIDAVNNLDSILSVPGLTAIVIGPQDLAGSMGHMGEPQHPDVVCAIDTIIAKGRQAQKYVGLASADHPRRLLEWIAKGVQWLAVGNDYTFLLRAANEVCELLRRESGSPLA